MNGKNTKAKRKETGTEMLARLMKQGFDRVDERFEGLDKRLDSMDEKLGSMDGRIGSLEQEIVALNLAQDETNRHLASIDRKQSGVLESLDETVHKKEFQSLVSRVAVLERKR